MLTANDTTFGIEIECLIPDTVRIALGYYHNGRQIDGLPTGWNAQTDGSIVRRSGFYAVEIVSPVLRGAEGLAQVAQVCQWLNSIGAEVNASCGLHVHVGWSGDKAATIRLTTMVANHEKAIFASTGTHSRERGTYCRGVRNDRTMRSEFLDNDTARQSSRYHVLNLTNLARRQPTVEFRAFAGTTNARKSAGYVRLCVGLVNKAANAKRTIKWDSSTVVASSPVRKGGEGQTELNRLFFALGWNKGRTDIVWGAIDTPDGCPTLADSKAKLMELAKKYDGE